MTNQKKPTRKNTPLEAALTALETMDDDAAGHWVLVPTVPRDDLLRNAHKLTGVPVETIHRIYNLMTKEE